MSVTVPCGSQRCARASGQNSRSRFAWLRIGIVPRRADLQRPLADHGELVNGRGELVGVAENIVPGDKLPRVHGLRPIGVTRLASVPRRASLQGLPLRIASIRWSHSSWYGFFSGCG